MKKPKKKLPDVTLTTGTTNQTVVNVKALENSTSNETYVRRPRMSKKLRQQIGIAMIADGAKLLGWEVAIPKTKQVCYMFLGEGEWMDLFDKHFPPKRRKP